MYKEAFCECDYCGKLLDDGTDLACRGCYEDLEKEASDLKEEIARLKEMLGKGD